MIGKTDVVICEMCKLPCEEEIYFGGHGSIDEDVVPLSFCSADCRDDHLEIRERIEAEVNKRVRAEFKLMHESVCPSCTRRLQKLV